MSDTGKKSSSGLAGTYKSLKEIAKEDKLLSIITTTLLTSVGNFYVTQEGLVLVQFLVGALLIAALAGSIKHVGATRNGVLEAEKLGQIELDRGLKWYQMTTLLRGQQINSSNISALLIMLEDELDQEKPSKRMINNIRTLIEKMHRNSMKGHEAILEKFENWAIEAFDLKETEQPKPEIKMDTIDVSEHDIDSDSPDINSKVAGHESVELPPDEPTPAPN